MSRDTFRKLWHDLGHSTLTEHEEPHRQEDLLSIKAHYSLVSLGTEKLLLTQKLDEETYERMKIPYLEGDFGDKFTYGYSLVGEVIDGPPEKTGNFVHVLHPHQERAFVKPEDVFLLPNGIDPKTASLASNMETVVNAVWDSGYGLGDRVLVIGYGTIGAMLSAVIDQFIGGELVVYETDKHRSTRGKSHGFTLYDDPDLLPGKFDIVFNASGNQEGLQLAIKRAGFGGKIIELSWYGTSSINLVLGDQFHYNRLKIISSQVGHLPAEKVHSWSFRRRKALVFTLLEKLDLSYLITREVDYSEAPAFYQELRQGSVGDIGVVIKY